MVERAKQCCEYCWSQARFSTQSFAIEHIQPISRGGKTSLENLALACPGCNSYKSDKIEGYDPINKQVVPLYHPRQDKWQEHFQWSNDFSLMIGITPIGRVTVHNLQLNRNGIVNLRKVLYEMGLHPPLL